jgi:hypothetical protein
MSTSSEILERNYDRWPNPRKIIFRTNYLTNSMELSPSWEAACRSATQEISKILRNPKVYYRAHKRTPLVPNLSQIQPAHSTPSYSFHIATCIPIARQRLDKRIPATHAHVTIGHLLLSNGLLNTPP